MNKGGEIVFSPVPMENWKNYVLYWDFDAKLWIVDFTHVSLITSALDVIYSAKNSVFDLSYKPFAKSIEYEQNYDTFLIPG